MFEWLQHIINRFIKRSKPKNKPTALTIEELERRKSKVANALKNLHISSLGSFSFTLPTRSTRKVNVFHSKPIELPVTLKFLAEKRAKQKHEALQRLEKSITNDFIICENAIRQEKTQEATLFLNNALSKLSKTKSDKLHRQYNELYGKLDELKQEITRRKAIRQAEELKRKREAEERRKAEEERLRQIREQKEQEERERKRKEQERLLEEAKKKEAAEQAERRRLVALCEGRKSDYQAIKALLEQNRIRCFYHFTDRSNLASIKRHGGLFSWFYCDEHDIHIAMPGGGELSRNLDRRGNLQDYVRVSFCSNHPMKYIAQKEGRINNPITLEIDTEVAFLQSTLFSNKNATKTGQIGNIGGTLRHLQTVNFNIVTRPNHFNLEAEDKDAYQAELLVKTWIPIKYILNINNFI